MKLSHFAVFSVVALSAAACGKLGSGNKAGETETTSANLPKGGSCNEEKTGVCTEYNDNPLGIAESACKSLIKGSYSKSACPSANLMGVCERPSEKAGGPTEKTYYYFGNSQAPWVEDATKLCAMTTGAKFTAQPNAEATAKEKGLPDTSKVTASCVKDDGSCDDVLGPVSDLDKSLCTEFGGKFNEGKACDSANLVGSCLKRGKVTRYSTTTLKTQTIKMIKTDCDSELMGGHWYPGPNAPADKPADAKPAPAQKAAPAKAVKGKK